MQRTLSSPQNCRHRQGFTLTELLVVVAIIAILVTLSFIGFPKFREYADRTNSIRNLSQLQMANAMYASENNGRYVFLRTLAPGGATDGRWSSEPNFISYLTGGTKNPNGTFSTTVNPGLLDPKVYRAGKAGYTTLPASYGMNQTGLMETSSTGYFTVAQIKQPARSMAFATATDFRIAYPNRYLWQEENDQKSSNATIAYRHRGSALVCYYDGHVEEISRSEMEEIDQNGGAAHPFWDPRK